MRNARTLVFAIQCSRFRTPRCCLPHIGTGAAGIPQIEAPAPRQMERHVIYQDFLGTNQELTIETKGVQPGTYNYLTGRDSPVRDYLAVVDSPSQLVETGAIAAEAAFECWQIHSPQVGDRLYLKLLQFFFRDFAYSW